MHVLVVRGFSSLKFERLMTDQASESNLQTDPDYPSFGDPKLREPYARLFSGLSTNKRTS